jgi:hypothetical protein
MQGPHAESHALDGILASSRRASAYGGADDFAGMTGKGASTGGLSLFGRRRGTRGRKPRQDFVFVDPWADIELDYFGNVGAGASTGGMLEDFAGRRGGLALGRLLSGLRGGPKWQQTYSDSNPGAMEDLNEWISSGYLDDIFPGISGSGAGGARYLGGILNLVLPFVKMAVDEAKKPVQRLISHGIHKAMGKGGVSSKVAKKLTDDMMEGGFLLPLLGMAGTSIMDALGVPKYGTGFFHTGVAPPLLMRNKKGKGRSSGGVTAGLQGGIEDFAGSGMVKPIHTGRPIPKDVRDRIRELYVMRNKKGKGRSSGGVTAGLQGGIEDFAGSGFLPIGSMLGLGAETGGMAPRVSTGVPFVSQVHQMGQRQRKNAGEMSGYGRSSGGVTAGLQGGIEDFAGGLSPVSLKSPVGGKKSATRSAAAKARAKTNPWLKHVASVRAQNPELAYKDVLKLAKQSY